MKELPIGENGLHVERIDDIPLIINHLQKIGMGQAIDHVIEPHKNWEGLSVGKLAEIWMSYIISEGDHRMNQLEEWAMERKLLFECLYNQKIKYSNFADDKLELVLDYLDKKDNWVKIESLINKRLIRVYRLLDKSEKMVCVRLDATIGQGHRKPEEGGLFQFGASKHFNSALPQFKIMMSTLDSEINGFAYPLASITVSGNTADDVLYLPILEQSKKSLNKDEKILVVGDKKLGSKGNRAHIEKNSDYYLSPLSAKQLSATTLETLIAENKQKLKPVFIDEKKVGKGFEYKEPMHVTIDNDKKEEVVKWTERRIVFQSESHAKSEVAAFDRKLEKTTTKLGELLKPKQGKKALKTQKEIEAAVTQVLKDGKMENYITVEISKNTVTQQVRKYKGKEDGIKKIETFELGLKLNKQKIKEYKSNCGWCAYATNAPVKKMKLKDVITMYRGQFQIETRFNDLKNKVTNLMPVYLQKPERVRSLINLMMIGLKAISAIEINAARQLKKAEKELQGIYAGNPKRGTKRPTAKMMLRKFKGITISIFMENGKPKFIGLTPLNNVHREILKLLEFKEDIYSELITKMKFNFPT